MIKITSLRTKRTTEFEFEEFISQFEKWETLDKRVFFNRVRTGKIFDFILSNYEFDDIDYLKFKVKYRV